MKCPRGYDPCRQIGCSCPIESRPIENVTAELEAVGVNLPALERETDRTLKLLREKLDLQAQLDAANERLDAVKKLIKGWRKIERLFKFGWEGYGAAADELEQALKGHDDREVEG